MVTNIILCILAYLLGSIPTSIWVSKIVFKIDIRNYGSGNAGATNSFRFLGKKWGTFIFIVDMLKGLLSVNLANFQHDYDSTSTYMLNMKLFLGLIAILGHIYPIYAQFRGGKGIATLFGVIIAIKPEFALIFAILFFLIVIVTNYVAIGSILSGISFVVCIAFFIKSGSNNIATILSFLCALIVILKHHTNIYRLLKGKESKTYFFKKNKEKIDNNKEK